MASRRKAVRRKTRRRTTRKGGFFRFIRTILVSATVSFVAVTWAINPQLLDAIDLDRELARFGLGSTTSAIPTAAPVDGYIQTTFAQCPQFFPGGHPPKVPARPALRELCFASFAILHSGQTRTPVFVAQRLNRKMLVAAREISRTDRFYEEGRLPRSHRATLTNYRDSGYDRGHMAPAGDMHTPEAMAQSFSLANMVPQNPEHNRGAWNKIEQDTRKYIMRAKGDVYVFTGSVYADTPMMIDGRVGVPDFLYKVVYDPSAGRAWVHWHENRSGARAARPIAYEEFVRLTGLRLLMG